LTVVAGAGAALADAGAAAGAGAGDPLDGADFTTVKATTAATTASAAAVIPPAALRERTPISVIVGDCYAGYGRKQIPACEETPLHTWLYWKPVPLPLPLSLAIHKPALVTSASSAPSPRDLV
jgi:hypothetical protein